MIRYINTLMRFLGLLLIPVIILPIILIGLGLTTKPKYAAAAAIYVDEPLYVPTVEANNGPGYLSPAQKQANYLTELLSSRSFITSVLEKVPSLSYAINTPDVDERNRVYGIIGSITIDSSGWHTIKLSLQYKTPEVAKQAIKSTIEQFFAVIDNSYKTQADSALAVYKKNFEDAQNNYKKAEGDLAQFVQQNAGSIGGSNNPASANQGPTPQDIEYARLLSVRDSAKRDYDNAKTEVDRVTSSYNNYQVSRDNNFRVLDTPDEQEVIDPKSKIIMTMGGAGIVGGLMLAFIGVLFLTWVDSTFRERATVLRNFSNQGFYIQDLPRIENKTGGKKSKKFSLRRSLVESVKWPETSLARVDNAALESEVR